MAIAHLSSFRESAGRDDEGFVSDYSRSLSLSFVSSSIFETTERDNNSIGGLDNVYNDKAISGVAISLHYGEVEVDGQDEGDKNIQTLPVITGCDWASCEVG